MRRLQNKEEEKTVSEIVFSAVIRTEAFVGTYVVSLCISETWKLVNVFFLMLNNINISFLYCWFCSATFQPNVSEQFKW